MDIIITIIATVTLINLLYLCFEFLLGFNSLTNLTQQAIKAKDELPSVSIILSALNEEMDIEAALTTILKLDYPNFEVIAINDRSTDSTPAILDRLQKLHKNLQIHHIEFLPENWMGKCHALYHGAKNATSEWLLFTDADVIMKPEALSKAISYALDQQIDHLTIHENHLRRSFWLNILLLGNYFSYSVHFKPWRIRYAWSKKSLGHGAFNLIKNQAYRQCGGHEAIALECLDDMKLGSLIKRNGFKQDTVDGRDFIEREWYSTLKCMIDGFKKNVFSVFNYRLTPLIVGSGVGILFFIWPLIAICFYGGLARWLNAANILISLLLYAYVAEQFRLNKWYAFLYPISLLLLIFTGFNSARSIYAQNGIVWRGTHYPLEKLKKANKFK